jgi:hypothetical protein
MKIANALLPLACPVIERFARSGQGFYGAPLGKTVPRKTYGVVAAGSGERGQLASPTAAG